MPAEERRERLEGLRSHVREHDLAEWVESQLRDLDRVRAHAGTGS
jgi:trehalose-6-phosphate synthase